MQRIKRFAYLPAFSETPVPDGQSLHVLAGDLGGTKTNLAIFRIAADGPSLLREATYASRDYADFSDMIHDFIRQEPATLPQRICIGVAGPVIDGKVELTNLSRDLTEAEIREQTGIPVVTLINDLEATAYGLGTLDMSNLITLHRGAPDEKGNMAIIAPGTGLGMAGIYRGSDCYYPFPTEGGHTDFCPRTDLDVQLLKYLQEKYEVASWERLVSGPGIYNIYQFLRDVKGMEEPDALNKAIHAGDPAAVIGTEAVNGQTPICKRTMELFVKYLGRAACNLVLTMKASGGLFLGGGIPPKIAPLLETGDFYNHYLQGDRMALLLSGVPVHIINNAKTALWGAAYYVGMVQQVPASQGSVMKK